MNLNVFLKGKVVPAGKEQEVINEGLLAAFVRPTFHKQTLFRILFAVLAGSFLAGIIYMLFFETTINRSSMFVLLIIVEVVLLINLVESHIYKRRHWSEFHRALVSNGAVEEQNIKETIDLMERLCEEGLRTRKRAYKVYGYLQDGIPYYSIKD